MTNILMIGATGTIGHATTEVLLQQPDTHLTLFSRRASTLQNLADRTTLIDGSVMDTAQLTKVVSGQNAVFAALSGNLQAMAKQIVRVMDQTGVSRLVFITSMGIYDEIPASVGASGNLSSNPMLRGYRAAADEIENSDLNYTVIRPGWFDHGSAQYEVTRKGEPFGGHNVAVEAVADLAAKTLLDPQLYSHDSVGINRPSV